MLLLRSRNFAIAFMLNQVYTVGRSFNKYKNHQVTF